MKVMLTPEIIVKVWKLHEKDIDNGLIADTLGISEGSARRVIQISAEDMFKEFAVSVLFELSHISKLLERICDDLGVNESGKA